MQLKKLSEENIVATIADTTKAQIGIIRETGTIPEYIDERITVSNFSTLISAGTAPVGSITVAADFPTLSAVKSGNVYNILANVTDNDATKTNTGLSFLEGASIYWNGTTWVNYDNLTTATQAEVEAIAGTSSLTVPSNIKMISLRGLSWVIQKFIALAHTWTLQQKFLVTPRLDSLKSKSVLATNSDGDIIEGVAPTYIYSTIGVGGEYADFLAAQTAGKYKLLAVGNVTLSGATAITHDMFVDMNFFTITTGTYTITTSDNVKLEFVNGIVPNPIVIDGKNNELKGNFTNTVVLNGTADSCKVNGTVGTVAAPKTLTLSSGANNCNIDIGVGTADNTDGTNNSIVDSSAAITNRIKTYKLT